MPLRLQHNAIGLLEIQDIRDRKLSIKIKHKHPKNTPKNTKFDEYLERKLATAMV